MELPEIKNFESLVADIAPNKKYIKTEIKPLTAPGENYASVALAVDIFVEDEVIHTVAKLLPSSQFMQFFMNIAFTVRNELGFYKTILPVLDRFRKEQSSLKTLDFFPKFYTGRLNLDDTVPTLDENCVIFLENLKVSGYYLVDRMVGFDLVVTKIIIEKMAILHASVMGLKYHQPKLFDEKLEPLFSEFPVFQMEENEGYMTSDIVINAILTVLQEDELCVLYIEKIRQMVLTCVQNLALPKNTPKFRDDLFATLIHDDLWVNNVMVKSHLNKIVDVKLLDWQLYEYASVTKDLMFFLCTSVEENVFKDNFDDLFDFYYKNLIANLQELKCDTEKLTFGVFQEELKRVSTEVSFFYVMIALPSIFASADQVWEVHELNKERILEQVQVSDACKQRICLVTRKFIQKGWI